MPTTPAVVYLDRMRCAAVLIALTGCDVVFPPGAGPEGRDAGGSDGPRLDGPHVDADLAHNEDGDAFIDIDDGCPHLWSANNEDGDGDGVGDACDPRPLMPDQQRVFFASFAGGFQELEVTGEMTLANDDVIVNGVGTIASLFVPAAFREVDIYTRVEFEAIDAGAPVVDIALIADHHGGGGSLDGASCRIGRVMALPALVTFQLHQDLLGGGDTQLSSGTDDGFVENFASDVHFSTRISFDQLECAADGTLLADTAPIPLQAGRMGLAVRGARVRFSYLFVTARIE
jgi:hypothetical protein